MFGCFEQQKLHIGLCQGCRINGFRIIVEPITIMDSIQNVNNRDSADIQSYSVISSTIENTDYGEKLRYQTSLISFYQKPKKYFK